MNMDNVHWLNFRSGFRFVCPLLCYLVIDIILRQDSDPIKAWFQLGNMEDPLAKLAVAVLSLVCNSANMERFFSVTGNTKSPARNRLSIDKMVKASVIKLDLNRQHVINGNHRKRARRTFGLPPSKTDNDPSGSRIEPELGHPSLISDDNEHSFHAFQSILMEIVQADRDAEHELPLRNLPSRIPTNPQVCR